VSLEGRFKVPKCAFVASRLSRWHLSDAMLPY
jgi:hypothetical protein